MFFASRTLELITKYFVDLQQYCNEGLGECTAFYDCSNLTVFNDGGDHINVRFNIEEETEACHYLEMCCDPEDVFMNPYRGLPTDNHVVESTSTGRPDSNGGASNTDRPWGTDGVGSGIGSSTRNPYFSSEEDESSGGPTTISSHAGLNPNPPHSGSNVDPTGRGGEDTDGNIDERPNVHKAPVTPKSPSTPPGFESGENVS